MVAIRWTDRALNDVQRLHRFLSDKNPKAGSDAVEAIFNGTSSLQEHPEIGRPALDLPPDYREWPVRFGSGHYLIFYRYQAGLVIILAVRHGREVGY